MTYAITLAMKKLDANNGKEVHLILELMHTNKVLCNAFSREVGLPLSELATLNILADSPRRGIGVLEIARRLGVNGAAITRQTKKMEAQGLVVRQADKNDRRRSNFKLTSKGSGILSKIRRRINEFEELLISNLEEQDIQTAKKVLIQSREALEKIY